VLLAVGVIAVGLLCLLAMAVSLAAGPVWVLLAVSSLWLPANNHHLEGPVLVTVAHNHGVTLGDLGGIGAFILATTVLVRRVAATPPGRRPAAPGAVLGYCCVVFALGALAAWMLGSTRGHPGLGP
jgi:hypothetical protein